MATTTFHRKARCWSALALLGLLLAGFRDRAGSGPALIQPAGSGLHLKKVDGLSAEFGGSTWVAGAVSAQWRLGEGGHREDDISEVVLVPTAEAAKRLPHFARYGVREIEIANEKEALARVFGAGDALRFSRRRSRRCAPRGAPDRPLRGRRRVRLALGARPSRPGGSARTASPERRRGRRLLSAELSARVVPVLPHGASPATVMQHIAIHETPGGKGYRLAGEGQRRTVRPGRSEPA
jgi:hypothetical protein